MLVPATRIVRVRVVQGLASMVTQLFDMIIAWEWVQTTRDDPAPLCFRGDDRPPLAQLHMIAKVHLIIQGHLGSFLVIVCISSFQDRISFRSEKPPKVPIVYVFPPCE